MKKVVRILVLLVLFYVATAYVRRFLWEKEAVEYAQSSVMAISRPWNADALLARASLSLKDNLKENGFSKLAIAADAHYGSFIKFNSNTRCKTFLGYDRYIDKKSIYANCIVPASFEKRSVDFSIQLLLGPSDKWLVNNLTF